MKPLSSLLLKPSGPECNLRCKYCFYIEKKEFFQKKTGYRMSEEVLETTIRQMMEQGSEQVIFQWQGGEPTLCGVEFFERAVALQKQYGKGHIIANGLQTNGTLLTPEWARFFRENKFLIGLSLDGPQDLHNALRYTAVGGHVHDKVLKNAKMLIQEGVEVNILAVVSRDSAAMADEIYDFIKAQGFQWMQFIPCVERNEKTGEAASFSVTPEGYGDFLCRIFDRWWADFDDGKPTTFVRFFDELFYRYVGLEPADCTLREECGAYLIIEHTGDSYSCDFFVNNDNHLGNVLTHKLTDMLNSSAQNAFGKKKSNRHAKCTTCEWENWCRGGCPKDRERFPETQGLSFLCKSYEMFFAHSHARLSSLAADWKTKNRE
jgi:uncharacterized protein